MSISKMQSSAKSSLSFCSLAKRSQRSAILLWRTFRAFLSGGRKDKEKKEGRRRWWCRGSQMHSHFLFSLFCCSLLDIFLTTIAGLHFLLHQFFTALPIGWCCSVQHLLVCLACTGLVKDFWNETLPLFRVFNTFSWITFSRQLLYINGS